jgi:CubicO group peptidase (beta-lactamase class C family)
MTHVHGSCHPRFAVMRDVLAGHLESGADVGASVAVVLEGDLVVDLWGGFADEARTRPWTEDTITNVWSSTKTMTALCALVLADRGQLDLDAPVATYWPEFAAAGKEGVLVRHLLAHTAGLPSLDEPVTVSDWCDWEKITSLLAAQAPWWEPGTASGYHAVTQGHLVGEVVRRVTGRTLGTFFAEEIAGPLGADFHIGLAAEHDPRVSNVIPPVEAVAVGLEPGSVAARAFGNLALTADVAWTEAWRRAEIPAANGHGNARSVALIQAVVSNGGAAGGVRLLSPQTLDRIFETQARGTDLVLQVPLHMGIGFGLNGDETPLSPNPRTCFWGGWGGSLVVNDLDARMTVAYMMNRMGEGTLGDDRAVSFLGAAYAALATAA